MKILQKGKLLLIVKKPTSTYRWDDGTRKLPFGKITLIH